MSEIYDPYSRPYQEDPYPRYKHFRDNEPCLTNPAVLDIVTANALAELRANPLLLTVMPVGPLPREKVIGPSPAASTELSAS